MQRGRQVPSWLVRRRYFQRFGHWLAPRRHAAADPRPGATEPPSNVLRFPGPAGGEHRGEGAPRTTHSA